MPKETTNQLITNPATIEFLKKIKEGTPEERKANAQKLSEQAKIEAFDRDLRKKNLEVARATEIKIIHTRHPVEAEPKNKN